MAGFRQIGCPSTETAPLLGFSWPVISFMNVDLPAPFGPRSPVMPAGTESVTSFNPITCTVLGSVQCCVNTLEPYIGLDVLVGSETSVGPNCTAGTCPTCPLMQHVLGSEPYVGNAAFSLDLNDAPGGSIAILFFNIGTTGPPVFSPPLCAGIRVPPTRARSSRSTDSSLSWS